jgi:hypothetical protein
MDGFHRETPGIRRIAAAVIDIRTLETGERIARG